MRIGPWMLVLIGMILGLIIGSVITSINFRGVAETTSYKTVTRYITKTVTKATTYTAPTSQPSTCAVFRALKDHILTHKPTSHYEDKARKLQRMVMEPEGRSWEKCGARDILH